MGNYIESYDIMYASIAMGEYFDFLNNDYYSSSTQLFILQILSSFVEILPVKINIFGYFLLFFHFISLWFFVLITFKYLENYNRKIKFLIVIVVLSLIADNIINLNSTRLAALGCVNLFLISKSGFFDTKKTYVLLTILGYSLFISLIRFEIVLLLSAILYLIMIVNNPKFSLSLSIPLIVSASVFLFYNTYGVYKAPLSSQIFYFFEHHSKFNQESLPPNYYQLKDAGIENIKDDSIKKESLKYSSLFLFGIPDTLTINQKYIDDVTGTVPDNLLYLIGRVNLQTFIDTLNFSLESFILCLHLILFSIFLTVLIFLNTKIHKVLFSMLFYIVLPVFVNLHIDTPIRFLYPYYSFFIIFVMINYADSVFDNKYFYTIGISCFLFFNTFHQFSTIKKYRVEQNSYIAFNNTFNSLNPENNLAVVEFAPQLSMISRSPLSNPSSSNIIFLSDFLIYNTNNKTWKIICNCDSESLLSKLSFVANNKVLFIYNNERLDFLKLHLRYNYNLSLEICDKIKRINDDLYISKICLKPIN